MALSFGSQAEYAAYRGVSRKTVTMWKHRGLLVFDAEGRVDFAATDGAMADHGGKPKSVTPRRAVTASNAREETIEEAARRLVVHEGRAPHSKAEAERIKENYLALLRQLEYDRAAGAVVEVDDVVTAVVSEYATVRNKLLGIGSKLAHRLAMMTSPDEVKAAIDREVAKALEELSLDGHGRTTPDQLSRDVQGKFAPAA